MITPDKEYTQVPDTADLSYKIYWGTRLLLRQPSESHEWDYIVLTKPEVVALHNALVTVLEELQDED